MFVRDIVLWFSCDVFVWFNYQVVINFNYSLTECFLLFIFFEKFM